MNRATLFCAMVLACNLQGQTNSTGPREWLEFREANPFHVQTLAITEPKRDGSRLLIIVEPPPSATLESIRALLPANSVAATHKHRVGFDGWVKDVSVRLPAMEEDDLGEFLARLQLHLFGTTYKAYVQSIPGPGSAFGAKALDLRVSVADLRRWLVAEHELFDVPGKAGVDLQQLLALRRPGVYFSKKPGLVAWVLPLKTSLSGAGRTIRHFALDSDLIIGGAANTTHLAVLARERVVGVDVLPPLRTETILNLAGSGTRHLAQSYERNYFAAGRFDAGRDWAPIYLSPELIDTEYGSLLNITDQLLKSWSENGTIEYINFRYPKPASTNAAAWPFPKPLFEYLGTDSVTYNWNTLGAGYTVGAPGLRMFALNRTGALPVSYLPGEEEQERAEREETVGYEYFSRRNDPNLVRVVQYASLYQIFQEFGITGPHHVAKLAAPGGDVQIIATKLASDSGVDTAYSRADLVNPSRAETRKALRYMKATCGESWLPILSTELVQPTRSIEQRTALRHRVLGPDDKLQPDASPTDICRLIAMNTASSLARQGRASIRPAERSKALAAYSHVNDRPEDSWIRTPSLVISWATAGDPNAEGGHNLDAEVSHIVISPTAAKGAPQVIRTGGKRIILVHPDDLEPVSAQLRRIAVTRDDAALRATLRTNLPKFVPGPPRRIEQALALNSGPPRPLLASTGGGGRGFIPPHSTNAVWFGQEPVGRGLSAGETALLDESNGIPFLFVEKKRDNSYEILVSGQRQVIQAKYPTSAVDAVVSATLAGGGGFGNRPPTMQVRGFPPGDADLFLRNVELELNRNGRRGPRPVAVLRDAERSPSPFASLRANRDFSRAKIGDAKQVVMDIGNKTSVAWEVPIEVPSVAPAAKGWFARVRLFFRDILPTREVISAKITRVVAKIRRPMSTEEAAAFIRAEMLKDDPELERIEFESDDLSLVELHDPSRNQTGIAALAAGD